MDFKNTRMWSLLGHRGVFAITMLELAECRDDIMVMTADLGTLSGLERFKNNFPERFFNVGIAEQNMIGMAAGLAREGNTVFVTTYSNFLAMRSYEQVRINLGYMQHNVKLVGTGAGVVMGWSGNSHYGYEDIALMRALPGMVILSPADGAEIIKALQWAAEYVGPVYIRLTGAMNNPIVYTADYDFQIGKAVTLRKGGDVTIFATGTMVAESLIAANLLAENGIEAKVVNMHTLKPLDTSAVEAACQESKLIISVEEHSIVGGLGGAIAEFKATLSVSPRQLFLGLPDSFGKMAGYKYLLQKYGLTGPQIAETISKELERL